MCAGDVSYPIQDSNGQCWNDDGAVDLSYICWWYNSTCVEYTDGTDGDFVCSEGYERYCREKQGSVCTSYACCKGDSCPPPCPTERQCGETCCDEGFQCEDGTCRTYCSDIGAYCSSCMWGGGYDCLEASRPSVSDYGYTCFNDGSDQHPIFNVTQNGCQAFCSATYNGAEGDKNYTPIHYDGGSFCCDDQGFEIGATHISEACCNGFPGSWGTYTYIPYAYGWLPGYTEKGSACCVFNYASISSHYGFGLCAKQCAAISDSYGKESYCNRCRDTDEGSFPAGSGYTYQTECVTPCSEWGYPLD